MRPLSALVPSSLLQRADVLAQLTGLVRQYLGAPLSEHTWVGELSRDGLVLITDGSVWVTRLRYQQHEILKLVSQETGLPVRRLRLRIAPPRSKPKQNPRRMRLSAENAKRLEASASTIRDPQLRRAMLSLSRRGRLGQGDDG